MFGCALIIEFWLRFEFGLKFCLEQGENVESHLEDLINVHQFAV